MPSAGNFFARSSRTRRFICDHLTLWLALLILATVVLSSVLAGAQDVTRKSAARSGQKRRTKPVAGVLNNKARLKLQGELNSAVSLAGREGFESELFMTPPSPKGAMLAGTSSNTLRATPNNDNGGADRGGMQEGSSQTNEPTAQTRGNEVNSKPKEERLTKAHSFNGDLRDLPRRKPLKRERPEHEGPEPNPTFYPGTPPTSVTPPSAAPRVPGLNPPAPAAPAPPPSIVFEGLDRENWGAGSPPDTTGDVGPTYYIQSVNTSVGIYRKSDGFREAAFTFDTLMSQGNFGNLCDTDNFGDPVVLYDTFEDRWILTDFAFLTDGGGNVAQPGLPVLRRFDERRPAHRRVELLLDPDRGSPERLSEARHLDGRSVHVGEHVLLRRRLDVSRRERVGVQQGADVRRQPHRQGRLVQPRHRRFHRRPGKCAPADWHAAGRTAELLHLHLELPQRGHRVQVPRRLEQHLAVDLHRP